MSKTKSRSQFLLYAAGAAVLAIGLGVVLYYASLEDDPVLVEVRQLGPVKLIRVKTESGESLEVIDFEYFNRLMKIVKTNLLKIETQGKEGYMKKRLELYQKADWEEYERLIRDNYVATQKNVSLVISQVCTALCISTKLYDDTNNFYEKDPSSW
jgi:hypothetical protein